jgi:hypothetical protein
MHRLVLAILLALVAVPAVAQDAPPPTPRVDLHLGLGYARWVGEGTESDDGSAGFVLSSTTTPGWCRLDTWSRA